jgi:hypothetical protein
MAEGQYAECLAGVKAKGLSDQSPSTWFTRLVLGRECGAQVGESLADHHMALEADAIKTLSRHPAQRVPARG